MHLVDVLALRPVPAAGIFFSITQRCPLTCNHCSTNSTMSSEEHSGEIFLRFVETFSPDDRPELLVITGGEALLRPKLVHNLVRIAHAVGTKVYLASGMFFARQSQIPSLIQQVITEVDHFAASLDLFHEREVPRAQVFRVLHELVERGQDVSFQVTGSDEKDRYISDVTNDIRQHFNDRVPVLVAPLGAVGRAAKWLKRDGRSEGDIEPMPCGVAAWPVVTYDGTVVGCCNQKVVDGPSPSHLRLGHALTDDWATIRSRYLTSTMMRAIRVFGPEYINQRYGSKKIACDGYCATCYKLPDDPAIIAQLEPVMSRPSMSFIEEQVIDFQQEHFPYGIQKYAHLRLLGYKSDSNII